ncbi:MAG: hypothetical protein QXM68_01460 [Candidatus Aenigmatarchaeota archaeon]|nr:hypothetical protein [Candidatus Aenigmarchaeota archaeon]
MDDVIRQAESYTENYILRQIMASIKCGCPNCMRLAASYVKLYYFGSFDDEVFKYITNIVKKEQEQNHKAKHRM